MTPLEILYSCLAAAGVIIIACITAIFVASTIRTIRGYFTNPPPAKTTPILKGRN